MKSAIFLSFFLMSLSVVRAAEPAYLGAPNCRIGNTAPKDGERAMWTGACKAGYAEGKGALQWYLREATTDRFEGSVERGVPVEGLMSYANGTQYDGTFRDGRRDGKGQMEYANGDRYGGSWKDGLRDGKGTVLFALGGRYDGEWKEGRWHGRGALTFAGGRRIDGQFNAGLMVGLPPRAELPTQRYANASDAPETGSNAPPTADTVAVPPEKSYAELTPAQQAIVRARYPLLDDDDEPPYPLNGSTLMLKWLREAQAKLPQTGMLKGLVQVDARGVATSVSLSGTPDPRFAQLVKVIMLNQPFKPALCHGKPCAMAFPLLLRM